MKNLLKAFAGIFLVAVCGSVIATGVINTQNSNKVSDRVKKYEDKMAEIENTLKNEKKKDNGNEDKENVLIGGQYQIKDTTNISEAYKKGSSDGLTDEEKETYNLASKLLKKIIKDGMSDFEKEKAIYEWLVTNVPHDMEGRVEDVSTPRGVLKGKKAVCVGYATTFRLLANMVGLECKVMHDTNEGHSWDLCKLDDGKWYITDCYMDAGDVSYASFNMVDEHAKKANHTWDASLFPKADGTKYSYSIMNAKKIDDPLKMIDKVSKLFNKDVEKGEMCSFVIDQSDKKNTCKANYIIEGIENRFDYNGKSLLSYKFDNKTYYSFYRFKPSSEEEETSVDFDTEKYDKMLNKDFGEIQNTDDYVG